MSKESKLMKNTAIIAIGNICTRCISFFMLPLYTSILSTQEYGTVDLVSTYVSLLIAVLTLQFEQGVFRYLIDVRNDEKKQKKYITTSLCSVVILNLLFTIIIIPILLLLNYRYTFYLALWVVIGSINAVILQLPRGLGNNAIYAVGSFLSGSSNVILNVLFVAVCHWGVKGMLTASIISLVISLFYITFRLGLWKYIDIYSIDKTCFSELCRYSLPMVPNALCWWIVNASDRVVIKTFMTVAANGIYSVASKFPTIFSMLTNIFQLSWTESAAENVTQKDSQEYFQEIINSSIRFYSSCNIGIIALMPFVFPFLVKADFVNAYYYIPILMTGALFHSIANLYGSVYTAFKMTKEIAKTTMVSAGLNLIINIAFAKSIGLYAAAISTLLSYMTITLWRHFDVQRKMKIKISGRYIITECFVYAVIFYLYYVQNSVLEIIALVAIVPYCVFQNRKFLISVIKTMCKKVSRG